MATQANKFSGFNIADRYCIVGTIGQGAMGKVYKAFPFDDPSCMVAIKVIQKEGQFNASSLMNFQKEAALMSQLYHPNIIAFDELGIIESKDGEYSQLGTGYYIVMEVAEGTDLKTQLKKSGRKTIDEFFEIAIQVASALDYTHGKNIIHRDIKPQNIIVGDSMTDSNLPVKVLDFGVARLAERMYFTGKQSKYKGIEDIAGTPMYMAPEQSEFINEPIDHRIDLYSLGCVLYETLVGRPPFSYKNREKLRKAHAFEVPENIKNLRPDIPVNVEEIINKLLAKNPQDRYQTAFGVMSDLLIASHNYKNRFENSAFALGLKDRFQSVSASTQLVGRENEFKQLINEYKVSTEKRARSRIVVLKGGAGVGKSKLLAEYRNALSAKKIRFISGAFSQHETNLPYNALANAFNDYLYKIHSSQPNECQILKEKFAKSLGTSMSLLSKVVPAIQLFQEDGQDDESEWVQFEDQSFNNSLFFKVFTDFTKCLATGDAPLVFIFDNIHYADEDSLELIDQFFAHNNSGRFVLILSRRHKDEFQNERLIHFLEKFAKLKRRFTEIELSNLDFDNISQVTSNLLQINSSVDRAFLELLQRESDGNPLHLVEYVKSLVVRDLISINVKGEWVYDVPSIEKSKIKIDTIDLILNRVSKLQGNKKKVLQLAALVGMYFSRDILTGHEIFDDFEVDSAIEQGVQIGLIHKYKTQNNGQVLYKITHNKARDILYREIPDTEKTTFHQKIVSRLEEIHDSPKENVIFQITQHLNKSVEGKPSPESYFPNNINISESLIHYNSLAGRFAWKNFSYLSAGKYFDNALKVLVIIQNSKKHRGQILKIKENIADITAAQRNFNLAVKMYSALFGFAPNLLVRHRLMAKYLKLQIINGNVSSALQYFSDHLSKLRNFNFFYSNAKYVKSIVILYLQRALFQVNNSKINVKLHHLDTLAALSKKQDRSEKNISSDSLRIYIGLEDLSNHVNRSCAVYFNTMAWNNLTQLATSPESLAIAVEVCAKHASLLSQMGDKQQSYFIFEILQKITKKYGMKSLYGMVCFHKAISIDFVNSRYKEVEKNLNRSILFMSPGNFRFLFSQAIVFRCYISLSTLDIKSVSKYFKKMPDFIPTRNSISVRGASIYLFSLLLHGRIDIVAKLGDRFMTRRRHVKAREDDIFSVFCEIFMSAAKGETESIVILFFQALQIYGSSIEKLKFHPYEKELAAVFFLFVASFIKPDIVQVIFDGKLKKQYTRQFEKIVTGIENKSDAFYLLCRGYLNHLKGKRDAVSLLDTGLRKASESQNKLALVIGGLWFSEVIRTKSSSKYLGILRNVVAICQENQLHGVVEGIKENYNYEPEKSSVSSESENAKYGAQLYSDFLMEANNKLTEFNHNDLDWDDLAQFCRVLSKKFKYKKLTIVVEDEDKNAGAVFYTDIESDYDRSIAEYVQPYLQIRSSLFLPNHDSPWAARKSGFDKANNANSAINAQETMTFSDSLASDSTIVSGQLEKFSRIDSDDADDKTRLAKIPDATTEIDAAATYIESEDDDSTQVAFGGSDANSTPVSKAAVKPLQMDQSLNVIVPLITGGTSKGVLFIENLQDIDYLQASNSPDDLDIFGSYLANLVDKLAELSKKPTHAGQFLTIEPCEWLSIWSHGKPDSQREVAWYIGKKLTGSEYILFHCRLEGEVTLMSRSSRLVWNHFYSILHRFDAQLGFDILAQEVRSYTDEIISKNDFFRALESFSFAFSIFNKDKSKICSGHFGSCRPIVLGQENIVSPNYRNSFRFQSGKSLRYWEVQSDIVGNSPYLLSYDTPSLPQIIASQTKAKPDFQTVNISRESFHAALTGMVKSRNLLRYYLAATLKVAGTPDNAKAIQAYSSKEVSLKGAG